MNKKQQMLSQLSGFGRQDIAGDSAVGGFLFVFRNVDAASDELLRSRCDSRATPDEAATWNDRSVGEQFSSKLQFSSYNDKHIYFSDGQLQCVWLAVRWWRLGRNARRWTVTLATLWPFGISNKSQSNTLQLTIRGNKYACRYMN